MSDDLARESSPGQAFAVPPHYRPVKCMDVLELDMGDGLILYNRDGDLVHHLNPSAGIVWQLCDGSASVSELGDDIAETYGLDPGEVESQIASVIADFEALGLVADAVSGATGSRR